MHHPSTDVGAAPPPFPLGQREFVGMLATMMAANALATDIMLPAFPDIGRTMAVTDSNTLQLIVGVFILGSSAGALLAGPLTDRFGRRGLVRLSLPLSAICAGLCALAPRFELMLVLRFLHGVTSGPSVIVATAIVRDRFEGDSMARVMSTVVMAFLLVPILAPALGQAMLEFVPWRGIFLFLSVIIFLSWFWIGRRLPETLPAARRRPLSFRPVARAWGEVAGSRHGLGYILAASVSIGAMFAYIQSAQQIFDEAFHARDWFPLGFAMGASGMAAANFINSRIVERFGARRVSHTAQFVLLALSLCQILAAAMQPGNLALFMILIAASMAAVSFSTVNFGSIAMEPFGHIAGVASSVMTSARMGLGGLVGIAIGQAFDRTVFPVAFGFCGCAVIGIILVLWAERGRLFTRPRRSGLRPPIL